MKKLFTLIAMCLLGVGAMQADSELVNVNFASLATANVTSGNSVTLVRTTTTKYAVGSTNTYPYHYSTYLADNNYLTISKDNVLLRYNGVKNVGMYNSKGSGTVNNIYGVRDLKKGDIIEVAYRGAVNNSGTETSVTLNLTNCTQKSYTKEGYTYNFSYNSNDYSIVYHVAQLEVSADGNAGFDADGAYIAYIKVTRTSRTACALKSSSYIVYGKSTTTEGTEIPTSTGTNTVSIKSTDNIATLTIAGNNSVRNYNRNAFTINEETYVPIVLLSKSDYTISSDEAKKITMYIVQSDDTGGKSYSINGTDQSVSLPKRTETPLTKEIQSGDIIKCQDASINVIFEVEYYSAAELTVADINWASLYLPFDATIPEGMKAYYAKSSTENTVTLKEISGAIPANTGVVVNAESGVYTLNAATEAVTAVTGNLFSGYTTDQTFTENQGYVLAGASDDKTSPIFRMYAKDAVLAAYKAYLPKSNVPSAGSGAKVSFVFDNSTTAINAVSSSKVQVPATRKAMENGKMVVITANGTYNVAGARIK